MVTTFELSLLKDLLEFFKRCDRAEMLEIYGENMGDHLWRKVNTLHRDWASWLCSLDTDNLEKLAEHLVRCHDAQVETAYERPVIA